MSTDKTTLSNPVITFIGGGNMANSLIGGLVNAGWPPGNIWCTDPDATKLTKLQRTFSIHTTTDSAEAIGASAVVLFAVKPQVFGLAAKQAMPFLSHQPLILSIAAGIRLKSIESWLDKELAIVRTMPNTPSLVQSGTTALFANPQVSSDQCNIAETIMRSVGVTVWVDDEAKLDVVTALSGSGPAYFFLIMEALEEAGIKLGLDRETANLLTLETAFGAAKMALEANVDSATLRAQVTSPGGTTESAINVLESGELKKLLAEAVNAASSRSVEIANLLGKP